MADFIQSALENILVPSVTYTTLVTLASPKFLAHSLGEIVHVLQMLNADWLLGEVAPFLLRQTHQEVFQDKRDLLVSIKSLKLGLNALLSLFVCSLQG